MEQTFKPNDYQPQANIARNDYSELEKRIISAVIGQINERIKAGVGQKELLNNCLQLSNIKGDNTAIRQALKSLLRRSYELTINVGRPDEYWKESGFLNWFGMEKEKIQLLVSDLLMPSLVNLARGDVSAIFISNN